MENSTFIASIIIFQKVANLNLIWMENSTIFITSFFIFQKVANLNLNLNLT